jgi:transposase
MRWLGVALIVILVLLFAGCSASAQLSDYCKSDYTPYVLIDNPSAKDVSYTELVTFLYTFKPEVVTSKTCGHYAEELHNYSENEGVRCAVVIANTHAFNGFLTDGKMTYVDAGEGIISIAAKDSDGLKFVKDYDNQIQIQEIGNENKYKIFWEAK